VTDVTQPPALAVQLSAEVRDALSSAAPVVALESTIISHGLPRPDNLAIARDIEQAVRDAGAVPATVAVVGGVAMVGLDDDALDVVASNDEVVKVSVRDLGVVMARGGHGATTVAATSHLAACAGIRVFATGGIGGVHREARQTWDESADLTTLSQTPVTLVCAGVKSILDVPATLERMETLNIPVLGYRTERFPGFYLADSGEAVAWTVQTAQEVAQIMRERDRLGLSGGIVVANPLPDDEQIDRELHDNTLATGLAAAAEQGVRGKDVTPFLLAWFHEQTSGASLTANVALVLHNARLAALIATAFCAGR
jgi:pseudouridine-5'-phosphate glycosidase